MTMSKSVAGIGQTEQEAVVIGGKLYAGVIMNARPFVEMWPRCICGFLAGKDHHNRGFDNGSIRTSKVESLLFENGKVYAITMNSAYCLESVNLAMFLSTPGWADDIDSLITQAIAPRKENKID